MTYTLYIVIIVIMILVLIGKRFLFEKPAEQESLAQLAGVPEDQLSYIFVGKNTNINKVDGAAPAVDPKRKWEGNRCVVVRAGQRRLDVGFYKVAVVGANKYNKSSMTRTFEAGKRYHLYAVMPDRRSVDYRLSVIPGTEETSKL